ncbi:MAG: alpha-glycosidase [Lachnospiraceae bacterium]|nr:alpha-glycosidase [Lachnospiraceae bacterium]
MEKSRINRTAILHRPYSEYCFAKSEKEVIVRLRSGKDNLEAVTVCWGDRMGAENPLPVTRTVMKKKYSDGLFDYYEADLRSWPITRLCYYFEIKSAEEQVVYFNDEFAAVAPENRQLFYNFHYIRKEDIPDVPKWVYGAVAYQIYPDSFANGDHEITPRPYEKANQDGCVSRNKNGGTLKGITQNLDYLQELGVNLIYTTPVFESNSWHGYDTIDYFKIDAKWGTKEDLRELVEQCHKRDMRVILDGVFNHCSPDFFAFRDVEQKGKESKYWDWFYIYEYPLKKEPVPSYECFGYVWTMPKLNTGNKAVADYLVSVGKYWIEECDIDGWRLDVANEVNLDFWRRFRREIRECKTDAYLIGEIWDDARAFLQGEQFDSVMNYNLYFALVDFFAKGTLTPQQFCDRVQYLLTRYKGQIQYAQLNLMGSHDVPRLMSYAGEDKQKFMNCALYLLTHVGVPMIYYGDELGMDGWSEEEYRKPMEWEKAGNEIHDFYRKLIALRRENQEVFLGDFETLPADANTIAYIRQSRNRKIYVVINNSEKAVTRYLQTDRKTEKIKDYLTGQEYQCGEEGMKIRLEPYGRAVLMESFF